MFYLVLISKEFSVDEKQFVVIEGRGFTRATVTHSTTESYRFRSFHGYDPCMTLEDAGGPGQYITRAGTRVQTLATLRALGALLTSLHDQTPVTPGRNSLIMMGKVVAAGMALLLISVIGTEGKEILPNILISNC